MYLQSNRGHLIIFFMVSWCKIPSFQGSFSFEPKPQAFHFGISLCKSYLLKHENQKQLSGKNFCLKMNFPYSDFDSLMFSIKMMMSLFFANFILYLRKVLKLGILGIFYSFYLETLKSCLKTFYCHISRFNSKTCFIFHILAFQIVILPYSILQL